MITGIATIVGGIAVMVGSGVVMSATLNWLNTFELDFKGKGRSSSSSKKRNGERAEMGRNRMGGGGSRPHSFDMLD